MLRMIPTINLLLLNCLFDAIFLYASVYLEYKNSRRVICTGISENAFVFVVI
jgi:hypothetical protein